MFIGHFARRPRIPKSTSRTLQAARLSIMAEDGKASPRCSRCYASVIRPEQKKNLKRTSKRDGSEESGNKVDRVTEDELKTHANKGKNDGFPVCCVIENKRKAYGHILKRHFFRESAIRLSGRVDISEGLEGSCVHCQLSVVYSPRPSKRRTHRALKPKPLKSYSSSFTLSSYRTMASSLSMSIPK